MQYSPQPQIAAWLGGNERFQLPKHPSQLLQGMRDGTLIWRMLTIHMAEPPPPAATITERWRQICTALLECGVELTPYGVKLVLLGDADTIDKVCNVLYSLHHPGGQGMAAVANLVNQKVAEPELLYPKLFHSCLVNATHQNFVDRVRILTDGCCTRDTTQEAREYLQLEALASHSKRMVEYNLAEDFFRISIQLMLQKRSNQTSLRAASLLKNFVLEIGSDASFRCLVGMRTGGGGSSGNGNHGSSGVGQQQQQQQQQHDDFDIERACASVVLKDMATILQSSDSLPELQDFLRLLLASIASAPILSATVSPAAVSSPAQRMQVLLKALFPASAGHSAALEQYMHFATRIPDRSVVRPLAPWLISTAIAILEGRDPEQESYTRFNPNGRFEDDFCEADLYASDKGGGSGGRLGGGGGAYAYESHGHRRSGSRAFNSTASSLDDYGSSAAASERESQAATPTSARKAQGNLFSGAGGGGRNATGAVVSDDDDENDAARLAKRTAEMRLQLQLRQANERREREVCVQALRVILRMWSEFPHFDTTETTEQLLDVLDFLRSQRGLELSQRIDLLPEIACAMFAHNELYGFAVVVLEDVKHVPELRRILLQNLCDYLQRPRRALSRGVSPVGGGDNNNNRPFGLGLLGTEAQDSGHLQDGGEHVSDAAPNTIATNRLFELLELQSLITDMFPQLSGLGEVEANVLVVLAKAIIQEFVIAGPTARSASPASQAAGVAGFGAGEDSSSKTPQQSSLSGTNQGGLNGSAVAAAVAPLSSRSFGGTSTDGGSSQGGFGAPGRTDDHISMKAVRQLFDLLISLMDHDPFFQKSCVAPWTALSSYFMSLPPSEPLRTEYLDACNAAVNELLTLSERHPYPDLLLQAIAHVFLDHPTEGRRVIAECIHMFVQMVFRRDVQPLPPQEAAASEAFAKRVRKLCELVGMPTVRVKVKVLDEEEALRLANARRAEEDERKRLAAEEAERTRHEVEQRGDDEGTERRKRHVRKPLYQPPEPTVRPGEYGRGSIFEYKRTMQWVRNTLVLGDLMDRIERGILELGFTKHSEVRMKPPTVSESLVAPGGQKQRKKYEEVELQRRREEQAEMERREILRRIRAHEVKEKLKTEAAISDAKKLEQLMQQEQRNVVEEESDARTFVQRTELKLFVAMYHMFRDEGAALTEAHESAQRRRLEAQRQREEEERQRIKDRVHRYWEEKEFIESQLLLHRKQEETTEAQREAERKRQYLDEQKKKLMAWRLQHQYDDAGVPLGTESSTSMMSDEEQQQQQQQQQQQVTPAPHRGAKKLSGSATDATKLRKDPSVSGSGVGAVPGRSGSLSSLSPTGPAAAAHKGSGNRLLAPLGKRSKPNYGDGPPSGVLDVEAPRGEDSVDAALSNGRRRDSINSDDEETHRREADTAVVE